MSSTVLCKHFKTYKLSTELSLRTCSFMMEKLLFISILLFVQYASTQLAIDRKPDSSDIPGEVSDPILTLLTELGLLILDVDEVVSVHTAPKVELEDRVKEQMYGRPGSDYFSRIRENYKTLQRRVGSLNLADALSVSSKLFGVNVKNEGRKSSVDVSIPSLPIQIQLRSENPSVKESYSRMSDTAEDSTTKGLKKIHPPESSFAGKIKVGDAEMKIHSTFKIPPDTTSEAKQGEPLTGHLIELGSSGVAGKSRKERDIPIVKRASDDLVSLFAQNYREFLSNPGPGLEDFKNEDTEVILDDVSYSKSTIDTLTKEALRNAKVALDSDLPPSEIIDELDALAKLVLARRRKHAKKIVSEVNPGDDAEATRKGKFERSAIQEPIDSVKTSSPDGGSDEEVPQTRSTKEDQTEAPPRKEIILSAYTNSGVPVKLRIGPEAGDPYRFLHRILSSYEVTLRVQMKPRDGIEPIGKEAPQLGSENGGPPTNPLYIDLSDINQRNSFLQTLRKFKTKPN